MTLFEVTKSSEKVFMISLSLFVARKGGTQNLKWKCCFCAFYFWLPHPTLKVDKNLFCCEISPLFPLQFFDTLLKEVCSPFVNRHHVWKCDLPSLKQGWPTTFVLYIFHKIKQLRLQRQARTCLKHPWPKGQGMVLQPSYQPFL